MFMEKVKITNLVKFFTLLLLNEGPKHGYDIMKYLEKKLGKKTSPGEIYPFLSKLQKAKYITAKTAGEREKKVYSLTREGKKFVKRMLNRFGDLIYIAVEPRVTVCAHCGCRLLSGAHKETIKGKILTFCCMHCAHSFKK